MDTWMESSPPLKLGILGAGRAAQFLHVPALLQLRDKIRVGAVCDPEEANARAVCSRFPGARIAADAEELLTSDLHAVAILTPPSTHGELALRALRKGKHVLVEKPLTTSAVEAAELTRAAQAAGLCAAVGHNLRFHRLVRHAAETLNRGELGRLVKIETRWISPAPEGPGWRTDRTRGGGVLFDLGVHHIDLARFLTASEFVELSAATDSLGTDDLRARASGVLANGVRFAALWSNGTQALHTVRLIGTRATIEFSMYSAISWRLSPVALPQQARDLVAGLYHGVRGRRSGGDSAASYRLQWLDFARAVQDGSPPACSFEDAAKNVAACEALAEAAAGTTPVAAEKKGPALSVVLAVHGTFAVVRHTVRRLRAQTARDQIELVLVWASDDEADVPEAETDGFFSCRIERVRPDAWRSTANAEGVRRAAAPVVAFAEDHCFPEPEWAEALIAAHARGYAAVGPEIANGNPGSILSWCDYLIGYGPWMSPVAAGEAPFLPGHNSSYKRDLLLEYGDRLEAMLSAETVLHYQLVDRGHRLYVEPRARTAHFNIARWGIWPKVQFHSGRVFAGSRAAGWSTGRKLFYAAASPLIPFVRLVRLCRELLLPNRPRHMLPRLLPALMLGLLSDGAGQLMGYLAGPGRSRERLTPFEYNRVLYIQPEDRRALGREESDPRAAT
jgi:predicted dehydrogenase